jgi:hypothetical protein
LGQRQKKNLRETGKLRAVLENHPAEFGLFKEDGALFLEDLIFNSFCIKTKGKPCGLSIYKYD